MSSSPHQERLADGGAGVSISTDDGTVVDRTSRVARQLHYSPGLVRNWGTLAPKGGLTMKRYFLLLLLLSPLLPANDKVTKVQRLEKVIWNPITHVLSWQITEGHIDVHGQFEPERLVGKFFIEPQAATMSFAGKKEGFTQQEGDHLHDILDSLSHYLMSSTLWWQEVKSETHEALKADADQGK